jgi:hypothetical protein
MPNIDNANVGLLADLRPLANKLAPSGTDSVPPLPLLTRVWSLVPDLDDLSYCEAAETRGPNGGVTWRIVAVSEGTLILLSGHTADTFWRFEGHSTGVADQLDEESRATVECSARPLRTLRSVSTVEATSAWIVTDDGRAPRGARWQFEWPDGLAVTLPAAKYPSEEQCLAVRDLARDALRSMALKTSGP